MKSLKYKILIKLSVLSFVLICRVYGDTYKAERMVLCLLVALLVIFLIINHQCMVVNHLKLITSVVSLTPCNSVFSLLKSKDQSVKNSNLLIQSVSDKSSNINFLFFKYKWTSSKHSTEHWLHNHKLVNKYYYTQLILCVQNSFHQ